MSLDPWALEPSMTRSSSLPRARWLLLTGRLSSLPGAAPRRARRRGAHAPEVEKLPRLNAERPGEPPQRLQPWLVTSLLDVLERPETDARILEIDLHEPLLQPQLSKPRAESCVEFSKVLHLPTMPGSVVAS